MDEEEQHRGLGTLGGGWGGFQTLVYDPKLSAGRGTAYSASAAQDVSFAVVIWPFRCCCCCSGAESS